MKERMVSRWAITFIFIVGLLSSRIPGTESATFYPTENPTRSPTKNPTTSPTESPTRAPTRPTAHPTANPSAVPTTSSPSASPSALPSQSPSPAPSRRPTRFPSASPTVSPTPMPTAKPTRVPSPVPTQDPTAEPTAKPTAKPTTAPTPATPCPTTQPTTQPTRQPSRQPSSQPSSQPVALPSSRPSGQPSRQPTMQPSAQPTHRPSSQPSSQPSRQPTMQPSDQPTQQPTGQPTSQPTRQPSSQPSTQPTQQPTRQPSSQPTRQPSGQPTLQPTSRPTFCPSSQPSRQPSAQPTRQPSRQPTCQPTCSPTSPTGQPSTSPSSHPSVSPTAAPSPKPTMFTHYNHTQRYESIDKPTFDYYTGQWWGTHSAWRGIDSFAKTGCRAGTNPIFPVCVDGEALGGRGGSNRVSCSQAQCVDTKSDLNLAQPAGSAPYTSCLFTPSDTIDFFPPGISRDPYYMNESDSSFAVLCEAPEDTVSVSQPYLDMDQGIPPLYLPFTAIPLNLTGRILALAVGADGRCRQVVVPNAKITAWQVDVTKLPKFGAKLHQKYTPTSGRSQTAKPAVLRDISCRADLVSHSEDGSFALKTTIPPAYGPPRHIMVSVSATGYRSITTRLYFDHDWRLFQLTTLNGEVQSLLPTSEFYTTDQRRGFASEDLRASRSSARSRLPGTIALDPRVVPITFVGRSAGKFDITGTLYGHFVASYDFILQPLRQSDLSALGGVGIDTKTVGAGVALPSDLDGLWSEPHGGLIHVQTLGDTFVAVEYPHKRTWGTVTGFFTGDTIRGVEFHRILEPAASTPTTSTSSSTTSFSTSPSAAQNTPSGRDAQETDLSRRVRENVDELAVAGAASSSVWSKGYSVGIVANSASFSSAPSASGTSEMSIRWSGGGVDVKWEKYSSPASDMQKFRYLKLVITAVTPNGYANGVLEIDEIRYYEGILAQRELPVSNLKMTAPRSPYPQIVACSSFQDDSTHCYKAFDGNDNSSSAWFTKPVGAIRDTLQTPQWVVLDLGPNRGTTTPLSALRIACGKGSLDTSATLPKGCPRIFTILGSSDAVSYSTIRQFDLTKYGQSSSSGNNNNNDGGYYVDGEKTFAFFWESTSGRVNGHRCGSCDEGPYFSCNFQATDVTCASRYCDQYGLCSALPACPVGEYLDIEPVGQGLPPAVCRPCPAGRYGNATGLISSYCGGPCSAGYYCPAGSSSSTQRECGGVQLYCPEGSGVPVEAAAGTMTVGNGKQGVIAPSSGSDTGSGNSSSNSYYGLPVPSSRNYATTISSVSIPDPDGITTRTGTRPCPKGHYCAGGVPQRCPAGRFGSEEGLPSALCTGLCMAGEYCADGSVLPAVCEKGYYCPDGAQRIACPGGTYGGTTGLTDAQCSGLCQAGTFCALGSSVMTPCPAGRYGVAPGSQTALCSGPCSAGYFCRTGSTNSTAALCGGPSTYCPQGVSYPITVSGGYYSLGGEPNTRSAQAKCEVGFYCKDGERLSCPTGTYGSSAGLSFNEFRLGPVEPWASPTRAPSSKPNQQPTSSPTDWTSSILDQPTNLPTQQPSRTEFTPEKALFYCSGICPVGTYCLANTSLPTPCPPGKYGAIPGLGTVECSGSCPIGHYCSSGTSAPVKCPAGTFGNVSGLISAECSPTCSVGGDNAGDGGCSVNLCEQGYYCPEGSVSGKQYVCGGVGLYCPTGSSQPTPVTEGYYTVNAISSTGADDGLDVDRTTRAAQLICERGSYCTGGLKRPCPPGTYGDTEGLSSATCSGVCSLGHYCPAGSSNSTEFRCPAGRYGNTTGLASSACSGQCSAGFYCPEGSSSFKQIQCGKVPLLYLSTLVEELNAIAGGSSNFSGPNMISAPSSISVQTTTTISLEGMSSSQSSATSTIPTASPSVIPLASTVTIGSDLLASYYYPVAQPEYLILWSGAPSESNSTTLNQLEVVTLQQPDLVFCPQGSGRPQVVLPGYFSTGGNATTRSAQSVCRLGTYCTNGIIYDCPAGKYGRAEGLMSADCTGPCQKGHFCLSGSITRTQYPCPAGRYGSEEGLSSALCSGACKHKLNCPEGTQEQPYL